MCRARVPQKALEVEQKLFTSDFVGFLNAHLCSEKACPAFWLSLLVLRFIFFRPTYLDPVGTTWETLENKKNAKIDLPTYPPTVPAGREKNSLAYLPTYLPPPNQ